jgi:hypothetical protein
LQVTNWVCETDRVVISLTRNVAFGIVKRISQAVGLQELEETYQSILDRDGGRLPVRIIDYAIKLDHFARFPKAEFEEIVRGSRKNAFSLRLVRDLTADYIYLFPTDFRVRQFIGDTLHIKVNTPQMLGAGSKKWLGFGIAFREPHSFAFFANEWDSPTPRLI